MEEIKKVHRKELGEQFKSLREEQGWSIEQVALMADVRESTIEKIEAGAFNVPMDILARVADIYSADLTIKERS
jgi:transcriptional regulator with XRE-family HTH domain